MSVSSDVPDPRRRAPYGCGMIIAVLAIAVPVFLAFLNPLPLTPTLDQATHYRCDHPQGIGLIGSINNYVNCPGGDNIPLGGQNIATIPPAGDVYRCAAAGKSLEVWTYGIVGRTFRILKGICDGKVVASYEVMTNQTQSAWASRKVILYGIALGGLVLLITIVRLYRRRQMRA